MPIWGRTAYDAQPQFGRFGQGISEHHMSMTMAAVFHHLCSSYGTRSDGTLRKTKADNAAEIGLRSDAYSKAFNKLIGLSLIDPDRRG